MGYKRETVEILRAFRKNMGSDLYSSDAKRIFKSTIGYLPDEPLNEISSKKLQYAKTYVNYLKVLNLVKFIGVSGSVAAGVAKEEDDIDFFIVVKNNTLWIYRGLMLVKNLFNLKMRKATSTESKDLICPNLIVEERGLKFNNDIFNLHELYFLKPVYNEIYYEKVLNSNQWLREWGGVIGRPEPEMKRMNIISEAINLYFFIPQLLYMMIKHHTPEIKRIFKNYIKGKIEFYPNDFKEKVISNLKSF